MHKLFLFILLALSVPAHAQSQDRQQDQRQDRRQELSGEAPPPPEYPQPGAVEADFARTAEPPPAPIQRPKKVDDDGNYYYGTEVPPARFSGREGISPPLKGSRSGEFFYDTKASASRLQNPSGGERPVEMRGNGEFMYQTERSPMNSTASFRLGFLDSPAIRNTINGYTFSQIYGEGPHPILFGDYEWRLTSRVGRLGVRFGSGIFTASGNGRFKSIDAEGTRPDKADERFTFFMFPNQITAIYKFQYAEKQILVPYVEGGGGYFTFVELRDDNKAPKLGAAPVTVAAGGVNFLLDWLDEAAVRTLDNQYGINHIWLTAEFRAIIGLNSDLDFTSNAINVGFLMDF